jgi:AcrR family transcriptional regulator
MTPPPTTLECLLDAAAALLAEGGLGDATTAKVARRAGVAEGTIYRHFATKDALLEAVFARVWSRLAEDLESRLPPRTDPEARLLNFLPAALAAFAEHPGESALISMEFLHLLANHGGGCAVPAGSAHLVGLLEESIRLAQGAGLVRPGLDSWVSASVIFHGVSKTWSSRSPERDPDQVIRAMQTFVETALLLP